MSLSQGKGMLAGPFEWFAQIALGFRETLEQVLLSDLALLIAQMPLGRLLLTGLSKTPLEQNYAQILARLVQAFAQRLEQKRS